MGKQGKIPWPKIRLSFITGRMSLRDLALEHSIDRRNLQRRAKREHWHTLRKKYRKDVLNKAVKQVAQELAKIVSRNIVQSLEQFHKLRGSLFERLHEGLAEDATPQTTEETQVATKTTGETALRRVTKKRTVPVDAKALATLTTSEAAFLKLAFLLQDNDQDLVREIAIT